MSGELATVVDKCKSLTCIGCIKIKDEDTEVEQLRQKLRQTCDKLTATEDQVTLLAAYPDLSNVTTFYHESISNGGDINEQMRRQIEANKMRLMIIDKENQKLNNALGWFYSRFLSIFRFYSDLTLTESNSFYNFF